MTGRDDFYVGYHPQAPRRLARFLAPRVGVLLTGASALAAVLAGLQEPPSPAVFEFGIVREFQGRIRERPYAMLEVGALGTPHTYLLVGQGKRGADDLVTGLDGREVRIEGTLIFRGSHTMVEVHGLPVVLDAAGAPARTDSDVGMVEIDGEIVDAKCHLGAMNPGSGSTHRACAIRCLLGGIPPLLATSEGPEGVSDALLVTSGGGPIDPSLLDAVGVRVKIQGRLHRTAGWAFLETDPSAIRRTRP